MTRTSGLGLLLVGAIALQAAAPARALVRRAGEVYVVSARGQVGAQWRVGRSSIRALLRAGQAVPRGSVFLVGKDSHLSLLVGGHTTVNAGEGARFAVSRLVADAKSGRKLETLHLHRGAVTSATEARYLPPRTRFAIVTAERVWSTPGGALAARAGVAR